jgi:hypothetical protein
VRQGAPLNLVDLNRSGEVQENVRKFALQIMHERISEQYESFTHGKATKKAFSALCAHVGSANQVKKNVVSKK